MSIKFENGKLFLGVQGLGAVSLENSLSNITFADDDIPPYVKSISTPLSDSAEFEFETEIDAHLFQKLVGLDLSNQSDITSFNCIFKQPYQEQVRKHKKKRINKKWAKRYGYRTKFKTYQLENVQFEHTLCGGHIANFDLVGRPVFDEIR